MGVKVATKIWRKGGLFGKTRDAELEKLHRLRWDSPEDAL